MANIEKWFEDFPRRCLELIAGVEQTAIQRDAIGTFSLMIAPSLLIAPYERLQTCGRRVSPQRDFDRFPEEKRRFDEAMAGPIGEAAFWQGIDPRHKSDWRYGKIFRNIKRPADWENEAGAKCHEAGFWTKDIRDVATGEVWKYLRDALSHWNVVTTDQVFRQEGYMVYLAFFSAPNDKGPWHLVVTTPESFLSFLKAWAAFLSEELPRAVFADAAA